MKRPPNNDLIALTDSISANEAGLRWLDNLKANADPLEKKRCILGPNWLCPFAIKGQGWPCQQHDPASKNLTADIYQITVTSKLEVTSGQLKLFENNWKLIHRHYKTGQIIHDPKPSHVLRVCQARSAAFIRWFENDQGWNPPKWKILPCTGSAAERMVWAWHMQARHPRLKPCIFEDLWLLPRLKPGASTGHGQVRPDGRKPASKWITDQRIKDNPMIELQSEDNALRIYNQLYDNGQYRTIGQLVATDMHLDRESVQVAMVMNTISDAAYMLCGHPRYTEAWLTLAIVCANSNLSLTTVDAITDYLMVYQQHYQDIRTGDYASTAKALLKSYQASEILQAATTCASDIHSWQGRMAHHLLYAAHYLTVAASLLTKQEDYSYIREKIQHALSRLIKASHEGLWHSKESRWFDFSEIRLPKAE